ncbi:hypothetical protein KSS87_016379 [Heliosperma pusillum]|nr:hypothetical protein KSS87_016379 [Heliosperma pusillum]
MEVKIHRAPCFGSRFVSHTLSFSVVIFQIILILALFSYHNAQSIDYQNQLQKQERIVEHVGSHSCIHDQIIEQRKRPGRQVYSVTPQVYEEDGITKPLQPKGRSLLGVSESQEEPDDAKQPIRIFLNYDAVGHSPDRDCRNVGDIVKLGEPPVTSVPGIPTCNPHLDPPVSGDCWYNCTTEDISRDDKKLRLHKALGQTADWFQRALAVEPVRGKLRLSGYSACGQDGGVQLPREYVEEGIANADLVLLVTTRPTTGNTLAWAVACERDQWGRAIAGHVNVAPRHLTAEAETLLSATLIHEVMHVLGFDPHAFAHFRDERKRRRTQVIQQSMDERLGRTVTRVVLPRVIMHSRYHYGAFSENFTGLELEDGGGRGTSGSHWEKRLLMNEIMTGSVDTRSVVSPMTLALLEDSGWYKVNYRMADHLDWGRNQGTEFVTLPCNQWKGAYHCNNTQLSGCTYNREAEGYCPIVSYIGDLPHWARYFPQANKGGQSSLADYCTYFVAYSDGSCTDTKSARAPDRMLGEVAIDGVWKACPAGGGPILFSGFNGELICPAYGELCSSSSLPISGHCPNSCNLNGDCVNGKCHCFLGFHGHDCSKRFCPTNCSKHGACLNDGICKCENGYTGIDCSTAVCDEQCSLHGGVCDNGICEFRCSDYAGYTCQNSSMLMSSLSVCKNVLQNDFTGQHCAPSEPSILQQLEEVVVMPNYHRLFPGGARKLFNIFGSSYCDEAAKRLACWISIQKCDKDGDNRLRVCHSACQSYNLACGASLDCSDQTLFSNDGEDEDQCTGASEIRLSWLGRVRSGFRHTDTSIKGTSDLVYELFRGDWAAKINGIPICPSVNKDFIYWIPSESGIYSIKSGYALALKILMENKGSTKDKYRISASGKTFTKRKLWSYLSSLKDDSVSVITFLPIIWGIWYIRNKIIFEHTPFSIQHFFRFQGQECLSAIKAWDRKVSFECWPPDSIISDSQAIREQIRNYYHFFLVGHNSNCNVFKIKVDAGWKSNLQASIGWVLYDPGGNKIFHHAEKIQAETATQAEALGIREVIKWALRMKLTHLQLDVDYVLFNDHPTPVTFTFVESTPPLATAVKSNEETIKKFEKDNKTARCFQQEEYGQGETFGYDSDECRGFVEQDNIFPSYISHNESPSYYPVSPYEIPHVQPPQQQQCQTTYNYPQNQPPFFPQQAENHELDEQSLIFQLMRMKEEAQARDMVLNEIVAHGRMLATKLAQLQADQELDDEREENGKMDNNETFPLASCHTPSTNDMGKTYDSPWGGVLIEDDSDDDDEYMINCVESVLTPSSPLSCVTMSLSSIEFYDTGAMESGEIKDSSETSLFDDAFSREEELNDNGEMKDAAIENLNEFSLFEDSISSEDECELNYEPTTLAPPTWDVYNDDEEDPPPHLSSITHEEGLCVMETCEGERRSFKPPKEHESCFLPFIDKGCDLIGIKHHKGLSVVAKLDWI